MNRWEKVFAIALFVGVLVVTVPYGIYLYKFGFQFSADQADWANLGSFLGGVTAPFLAFLSMALLYLTFRNQIKVQEQNNLSSFETSFFNLLNIFHQNELATSFNVSRDNNAVKFDGKAAFDELYVDFKSSGMRKISLQTNERPKTLADAKREYESFYLSHGKMLGHFFRSLYNIVNYVDSHESFDRQRYINILVSNLNNSQLALLLFNVNSNYGSVKFRPLAKKYFLLENLNYSDDLVLQRVYEAFKN